jgi:hypothetical protein
VKAIAKFHIDFARQIPVKSPEREAVVVEDALVGDIEGGDRGSEAFPKILAEGEIEGGVAGEIVALVGLAWHAGLSVVEAGTIVDVRRGIGAPGKANVSAHVQRVPLVMVERAESGREREIGETSCDGPAPLGDLVGVGEVNLDAVREAGRAQGEFPSANQGLGNGNGEKDVRRSDIVVVKKIGDVGLEVIGVEDPPAERDGNAELMFFVAFTGERQEAAAGRLALRDQRTGDGFDRRCLIVVPVEGTEVQRRRGMVSVAPKRGWMADSEMGGASEVGAKLPSENRVGRMPAESVSHEKGLNLSSM